MNENRFIGAYWSARKEDCPQCADRIVSFLLSIKDDQSFSGWFLKTRSRKAASVALDLTAESIEAKLKTNKQDVGGEAIQELGFSLSIWNGSLTNQISFAVTCGAFSDYLKNSAVLYLPQAFPPQNANDCEPLYALVKKMVAAFDPDCAVASSTEYLIRGGGGMPWETGGWVEYRRGQPVLVKM